MTILPGFLSLASSTQGAGPKMWPAAITTAPSHKLKLQITLISSTKLESCHVIDDRHMDYP